MAVIARHMSHDEKPNQKMISSLEIQCYQKPASAVQCLFHTLYQMSSIKKFLIVNVDSIASRNEDDYFLFISGFI